MIFPLSITMFPSEIPDVWCQIPRFVSHPSSFSAACHAKCLTALDSGQIELIELVLFDASGTIAVISVKRGPDRFLLLWLQQVLDVGICLQLKVLNNFISQHIYICIYTWRPGGIHICHEFSHGLLDPSCGSSGECHQLKSAKLHVGGCPSLTQCLFTSLVKTIYIYIYG